MIFEDREAISRLGSGFARRAAHRHLLTPRGAELSRCGAFQ
jgi:hypothetical protein